jgi:hypothetical protein
MTYITLVLNHALTASNLTFESASAYYDMTPEMYCDLSTRTKIVGVQNSGGSLKQEH